PGDHGFRHGHARGRQPPCRRAARSVSNGWRSDRGAVRRPRRTEDERRAAAAPARPARARGRNSFCHQSGPAARDPLFRPRDGRRRMTRISALAAAFGALIASAIPAAGERLVASLSNHRVMITSNFVGEELVLFGGIEQDAASRPRRAGYDIIVTVTGPRQTMATFRKERILGLWVNADSRVLENAPAYLAVLSNRPLDAITNTETLRRLQLGLDN